MTRIWQHQTGAKGRRRQDEILGVAAELFTTGGYEPTTSQEIADAVGLTKGSLYYYFASKEELLFQVLLQNQEKLHRYVVEDVRDAGLDGLDAVGTFISRHVLFVLTNRAVSSLYGDEVRVVQSVGNWWEALVCERRKHEACLRRMIERAQADGTAAGDINATFTTRALLGVANSPLRWFHAEGRYCPETIARHHADLALRSLRPT